MIAFPPGAKVRRAGGAADLQNGTNRLALLVQQRLRCDPHAGEAKAAQGADWLLAVKANQPGLRAEVEAAFAAAPAGTLEDCADFDKGHGRIEARRMAVPRDTDWLDGVRRFPGALRLPGFACLLCSRDHLRGTPTTGRPLPRPHPLIAAGLNWIGSLANPTRFKRPVRIGCTETVTESAGGTQARSRAA